MKTDTLRRDDFDTALIVYSAPLLAKIRAVSRSGKVRRLLTREERAELESIHGFSTAGYFMHNGRQLCLSIRDSGEIVLFQCA